MTKKDYIKFAKIIRDMADMARVTADVGCYDEAEAQLDTLVSLTRVLVETFKQDNARFNEDIFLEASGMDHINVH